MDTTIPYDAAPPVPPSVNGHGPPADGADSPHLDQAGGCVWRYSRQDIDRETTRYLSAATQLDVKYALEVVRKVINEPIRALAPAYGVDVAVVTRWAVDSLLRSRSRRDIRRCCSHFSSAASWSGGSANLGCLLAPVPRQPRLPWPGSSSHESTGYAGTESWPSTC